MALSLQNFLNNISDNQIRTQNMFELYVSSGYPEVDNNLKDITMYGQGFSIPSRTQNFNDAWFKGYPVPVPSNMIMENEHTFTMNADAEGRLRRTFLRWQAITCDPAIGDGSLFAGDRRIAKNSYVRVCLLDNDMETVMETYRLVGVKVQNVGAEAVSNVDAAISTFEVQLKSVYWEIEQTKSKILASQR